MTYLFKKVTRKSVLGDRVSVRRWLQQRHCHCGARPEGNGYIDHEASCSVDRGTYLEKLLRTNTSVADARH